VAAFSALTFYTHPPLAVGLQLRQARPCWGERSQAVGAYAAVLPAAHGLAIGQRGAFAPLRASARAVRGTERRHNIAYARSSRAIYHGGTEAPPTALRSSPGVLPTFTIFQGSLRPKCPPPPFWYCVST
jgi:hypothetical protein